MGYKLCIADKASSAKDIACAVGADKISHKGYYEGNNYYVTWLIGPMVSFAEPEDYGYVSQRDVLNENFRDIAENELPLLPSEFKLIVLQKTKIQYNIVKELMHRDEVELVIDCGELSPDRHAQHWLIRQSMGCYKPVKRFCALSMTNAAIRAAMNELRDVEDFLPTIQGELCRRKADWILGMSLSRAESIKYNTPIVVGRVQSQVLAFVVAREREVTNYVPENYYTLCAKMSTGNTQISAMWSKDTCSAFPANAKDKDGHAINRRLSEITATECCGQKGKVTRIEKRQKPLKQPTLYNASELQRDANQRYGYSIAQTATAAHILYTQYKVISCPETNSHSITPETAACMESLIKSIGQLEGYQEAARAVLADGLNLTRVTANDCKGECPAIVPTEYIEDFDFERLEEFCEDIPKGCLADILELVLCRTLLAVSQPFRCVQMRAELKLTNGLTFYASGEKPEHGGWRDTWKLLPREQKCNHGDDELHDFPALEEGQFVTVDTCSVVPNQKAPPRLHTEATLLVALESAGSHIENGVLIKGTGIGALSTRPETIRKLYQLELLESIVIDGTKYIRSTLQGKALLRVLPSDIVSSKIAADWESKMCEVAEGKATEQSFMDEFSRFIAEKVKQVRESNIKLDCIPNRNTYGTCPWCGSDIRCSQEKAPTQKQIDFQFYCSSKQCSWRLSTDNIVFRSRTGRNMREEEARCLIRDHTLNVICRRKCGNGSYPGVFSFGCVEKAGKKYCTMVFAFPSDSKTR